MLKTSKILILGLSATTVGLGSYIVYTKFFAVPKKTVGAVKTSSKVFDTVPEKDSSLDRLNKILADNNAAKEKIIDIEPVVVETYENIDKNSALYDSLVKAGSVIDVNAVNKNKNSVFETNAVIKADKFIDKKVFSVIGYNGGKNDSDSLLNALINVRPGSGGKITVEFWESPIHFKGYRLGKEKMVVFGVLPDDVSLIKHKNELYFVTINNVYLIKPCTDFCQLKPIKDKAVCADVLSHVN